ncbi:hypothetical protein [Burkholderia multivorans]|uniref:hypothetical protein n=1 Tax=Burkholderia multivorans TaxID=87883 RepID=UPI000CFE7744|nr:hypothetical protein [Burkholderia multivorans]MBU9122147.1 hypothetical protein [Burkholderia multivorans]PRF40718.1 hypothetical protein C6Q04_32020 [Burkholderia multivorans]PRG50425.1 hypothetical protein C6T63_18175 [Burkholderia multivorans]
MKDATHQRDDLPPRSDLIAKLEVLEAWAETEIPWRRDAKGVYERDAEGERVLDFVPTRDIHFASWDGTQNCEATKVLYPQLERLKKTRRRTAPESHPDLQSRLDDVLKALRAKAITQLETANKTTQIAELESSVNFWQSLAHKQEAEIVALRERMSKTERELREAKAAVKGNQVEWTRVAAEKDAKIASLTELISKISPIR